MDGAKDTGAARAPTDGVNATWSIVEKALTEARSLYMSSRVMEDVALAALEAFLQFYGEAARQPAGKWIQMAQGARRSRPLPRPGLQGNASAI